MPAPAKFRTNGYKLTDTSFKSRVQSPPGTDIQQSTISSISYTVTEMIGPQQTVVTGSGSLTVSSVVFNMLQSNDPSWTQDNTGYNFSGSIPGAQFPDAGDYVVEFLFTPSGGGSTFPVIFYHHCNSRS